MRNLFFQDFGWKLFSLLLAAFIWYTVQRIIEEPKAAQTSPANIEVQYDQVPVAIVATAADRHLFQLNSNSVLVTVSGPPSVMNTLQRSQILAMVNLSDFNPKARNQERTVDVAVPWGVTVIDVEPSQVRVLPPPQP